MAFIDEDDVTGGTGARPTPKQIKEWYQQISLLLNRLEGCGEEFTLVDTEDSGQLISGLTGKIYKTNAAVPGTWSWQ